MKIICDVRLFSPVALITIPVYPPVVCWFLIGSNLPDINYRLNGRGLSGSTTTGLFTAGYRIDECVIY